MVAILAADLLPSMLRIVALLRISDESLLDVDLGAMPCLTRAHVRAKRGNVCLAWWVAWHVAISNRKLVYRVMCIYRHDTPRGGTPGK